MKPRLYFKAIGYATACSSSTSRNYEFHEMDALLNSLLEIIRLDPTGDTANDLIGSMGQNLVLWPMLIVYRF